MKNRATSIAAMAGNGEARLPLKPTGLLTIDGRIITILYQGIWTYVFGPWLLWKIRNIHDVFNWKLQTVLAIVFR